MTREEQASHRQARARNRRAEVRRLGKVLKGLQASHVSIWRECSMLRTENQQLRQNLHGKMSGWYRPCKCLWCRVVMLFTGRARMVIEPKVPHAS